MVGICIDCLIGFLMFPTRLKQGNRFRRILPVNKLMQDTSPHISRELSDTKLSPLFGRQAALDSNGLVFILTSDSDDLKKCEV